MLAFAFISSFFFCASLGCNRSSISHKHRATRKSRISRKRVLDGVLVFSRLWPEPLTETSRRLTT